MSELDGVWKLERTGGALPPLAGVEKRIRGDRGTTEVGPLPGLPFAVRGLELHYEPPFAGFVDVLEPDSSGGYAGRATFRGHEYGRFRMARAEREAARELVRHLDEAHAMEQSVLRALDGMVGTTHERELRGDLERHRDETREHAARMRARLAAHDASPSALRELGGLVGAVLKLPLDAVRGESDARNARDAFATEHLEIASYELLERVARLADDAETAEAARRNREDEQAMAERLAGSWDRLVRAQQASRPLT